MSELGFPSLNTAPGDDGYAIDQLGTHPQRWGEAPLAGSSAAARSRSAGTDPGAW